MTFQRPAYKSLSKSPVTHASYGEDLSINLSDEVGLDDSTYSDGKTSVPFLPVNLFSVPAILSHISQTDPGFIFTFLHNGRKHKAVLMKTFLTALDKEGVKITWDEAISNIQLGCHATVDVTQVKPASVEENWLVFGLYLSEFSSSLSQVISSENCSTVAEESLGEALLKQENSFGCDNNFEKRKGSKDETTNSSSGFLSCKVLNHTFTLEEDSLPNLISKVECSHNYEAEAVVVSISSQYLHLVVQLGDTWVRVEVDPLFSTVMVDGIRAREVFSVKIGAIGTVVLKKCVQYHSSNTKTDIIVGSHVALLWFGDKNVPSVRGSPALVVANEDDRLVVQVEDTDTLVHFYGKMVEHKLELQTRVLVWAWSQQLSGERGSLEGAAIVVREDIVENDDEEGRMLKEPLDSSGVMDLSIQGIFSPIRSGIVDDDPFANETNSSFESCLDNSIGSLSVSFGSMGELEPQNDDFSMLAHPDLSSKHMEEVSLDEDKNLEMLDLYFQSLFWRSSSPKPDAVIDAQFDTVLAVNDVLHSYNNLVDDFDELIKVSDLRPVLLRHSTSNDLSVKTLDCEEERDDQFLSFLDPVGPIAIDQSLVRRKSNPSLSPIPEETGDGAASLLEDPVFAGPYLASTPSGRCQTIVRTSLSLSGSPKCDDESLSNMDSGYGESFSSGSNTTTDLPAEASPKTVKNILEQFLEFAQLSCNDRAEVIDRFLAQFFKETQIQH